jgi:hypothetical protein
LRRALLATERLGVAPTRFLRAPREERREEFTNHLELLYSVRLRRCNRTRYSGFQFLMVQIGFKNDMPAQNWCRDKGMSRL